MNRDKLILSLVHSVTWEALAGFLDEGTPDYVPFQGRAIEQALDLVNEDDDLILAVHEAVRSDMYYHLQQANALAAELNKEAGA